MTRRQPIVAIDGPAGTGKSSVSREVARRLRYAYVDTGAMYRVVGLIARERGLDAEDDEALGRLARSLSIRFEPRGDQPQRVLVDDRDVTGEIRSEQSSQWASRVSAQPSVRRALIELQRRLGGMGGAVVEGRDMGTVVFPDAELKFFLDAGGDERARRRWRELRARGESVELDSVVEEMADRDRRDQSRAHAPLRQAPDAERIDTTDLSIEEVVDRILSRHTELERGGGWS